jgi:hypothetical protein
MESLLNGLLNTVFVSIPEAFIWCVFVLFLMKRADLLDVYRWEYNLKQIMIPVIPVAVSINLMRYVLQVDNLVNFIIIEIMMMVLVTYIIQRNNILNEKINYLMIIVYVLLADFVLIITTEGLCALVIISLLDMSIETINNNIFLNIILSFVPRTIQILLISVFIYKQNLGKMIDCIELILKNKVLSISMGIFLATVMTVEYILGRFFIVVEYFDAVTIKLFFAVIICIIPIILISSYVVSVYNLLWINLQIQKQKDNMLNEMI